MSSELPIILSIFAFLFTCISFVFVRGEARHNVSVDLQKELSAIKTDIQWIKRALYPNNKKND